MQLCSVGNVFANERKPLLLLIITIVLVQSQDRNYKRDNKIFQRTLFIFVQTFYFMVAPKYKNQILKLLQEKKSLGLEEVKPLTKGFESINELESDKYVKVIRDSQGKLIVADLTQKGVVFIQNGGYDSTIIAIIKFIGKFIGSLFLKSIGLVFILLAIHIIQSLKTL